MLKLIVSVTCGTIGCFFPSLKTQDLSLSMGGGLLDHLLCMYFVLRTFQLCVQIIPFFSTTRWHYNIFYVLHLMENSSSPASLSESWTEESGSVFSDAEHKIEQNNFTVMYRHGQIYWYPSTNKEPRVVSEIT